MIDPCATYTFIQAATPNHELKLVERGSSCELETGRNKVRFNYRSEGRVKDDKWMYHRGTLRQQPYWSLVRVRTDRKHLNIRFISMAQKRLVFIGSFEHSLSKQLHQPLMCLVLVTIQLLGVICMC